METAYRLVIILAAGFAAMSPLIFIAIREAIKRQRQEIIKDLALVFEIADRSNVALIPSFEFVKYKYFVGKTRRAPPAPVPTNAMTTPIPRWKEDYSVLSWVFGSIPFSTLTGLAMFYALSLLVSLLGPEVAKPSPFRWSDVAYPVSDKIVMVWLLGLCAAFAGSYITALRNLYRALKNFDLSPGSFVGETIRMLLSFVLAPILVVGLLWIGTEAIHAFLTHKAEITSPAVIAVAVAACFIAGIMPDVVLRGIMQRDRLKNFKREEDVFEAFKITPVEIIDGIDSEIRVRLDDHHIRSTQNLAAANPLMLFVETPYGVYQIMDWVAQAQLCCSVGRERVIRLWPLGIRTLFDLERLAASEEEAREALLLEVGRIILGETVIAASHSNRTAAAAVVRASIDLRLDDPHVQRLRQIYIAVGDRLGLDSRRFRPNGAPRGRHPFSGRRGFYRSWSRKRRPTGASNGTTSSGMDPGPDSASAAQVSDAERFAESK